MKEYDYLVVGAGLFAAVFVRQAIEAGKRCLVIDKRSHIGGNIYCENVDGIHVHQYGAHIFHTDNKQVWDYVNRFVSFNRYTNSPLANYKGKLYNLPFNMNTFNKLWGVNTPQEAKAKIEEQRKEYAYIKSPANLEEQALTLCGKDIYQKLIKGYTEKQWGRSATELPAFIIKRLPFRYFSAREELDALADKVLFTGCIDEFYDYRFGRLEYRSLCFEHERLEIDNYQGNAVVNYCEREIPYTRIIEHKHFEFGTQPCTVITREYPAAFTAENEPYYPVNDDTNMTLLKKYKDLANTTANVLFGGRLAQYAYFDMDDTVEAALNLAKNELKKEL